MCREDGSYINLPLSAEWQRDTCQPLVKLGDDGVLLVVIGVLATSAQSMEPSSFAQTHLA